MLSLFLPVFVACGGAGTPSSEAESRSENESDSSAEGESNSSAEGESNSSAEKESQTSGTVDLPFVPFS